MNQIVPSDVSGYPTPISPAVDRRLSLFANRMVANANGHEIEAVDAPTDDDRAALERRANAIQHWMTPAEKLWLLDQVTALIGTMPRQNTAGSDDTEVLIKLYRSTLADLPRFALSKAFQAAHKGGIGNPPWLPTVAEIYAYATRLADPYRAERRKLRAVLAAVVVPRTDDVERRKRTAALVRASLQPMREAGEKADAERCGVPWALKITEAPEQALERLRRASLEPLPLLSEEARRLFAETKPRQQDREAS